MTVSPPTPLLNDEGISRLREALTAANYTETGLLEALGPVAPRMPFSERRTFVEATDNDQPVVTLYRLFLLGQTPSVAAAEAALSPLPLADAISAGLVERVDGGVRAKISVVAQGEWWMVSDLPARLHPGMGSAFDHVLEFGPSSQLLARVTCRRAVDTALDIGTGCGGQAVRLSKHAKSVTCTDISTRALRFAATTAALNGLDWELLHGDLVEPVSGRQFDLAVFNAPFVVSPGEPQQLYRDAGREADGLAAELIGAAPKLLAPGGVMQFLAHWLHIEGQDWQDRVGGWLAGTGLDALVIQTNKSDLNTYVSQWITTERPAQRPARATAWLDWFAANNVAGMGGGLIVLRAGGREDPTVRFVEAPLPPGELGDSLLAWFDGCELSRTLQGPALWDARLRAPDSVRLYQSGAARSGRWEWTGQLLAIPEGMEWKVRVDSTVAALVGACDGTRPLGELVNELAAENGVSPTELTASLEETIRLLVERGHLVPAEP